MSVALPRTNATIRSLSPSSPSNARFPNSHYAGLPPAAGSYLTADNQVSTKSKSFLNLTTSSLSGVFGSQMSLSELAGDSTSNSGLRSNFSIGGHVNRSLESSKAARKSIDVYDSFLNDANRSLTRMVSNSGDKPQRGSMTFPSSANSATRRQATMTRRPSLPALTPSTNDVRLSISALIGRLVALFVFGIAYGELASQLYDNNEVTTKTLNILRSQNKTLYLLVWGLQGSLLGFLFPFFDWLLPEGQNSWPKEGKSSSKNWNSALRAVFAFLGLGLGVRKLPWESSEQVAALCGLVNPGLWYLLDGTRNGLILSSVTAIVGFFIFALALPSHLPQPGLTSVYAGVAVWIASVNFSCSICFGSIGRRILAFVDVSSDES